MSPQHPGNTVTSFPQRIRGTDKGLVETGGGPPHDGDMEGRVAKLEETMAQVRERLAVIDANLASLATKADVATLKGDVETRLATIDGKLNAFDSKIDGKFDLINQKLDKFPTKLQLTVWSAGGLIALLGIAASLIALLLKLSGHLQAAEAVNAIRGK